MYSDLKIQKKKKKKASRKKTGSRRSKDLVPTITLRPRSRRKKHGGESASQYTVIRRS